MQPKYIVEFISRNGDEASYVFPRFIRFNRNSMQNVERVYLEFDINEPCIIFEILFEQHMILDEAARKYFENSICQASNWSDIFVCRIRAVNMIIFAQKLKETVETNYLSLFTSFFFIKVF